LQVMWRYTILYMTERCYESGGLLWDQVFNHVCWCLFIFEFFTGALMSNSNPHAAPALPASHPITPQHVPCSKECPLVASAPNSWIAIASQADFALTRGDTLGVGVLMSMSGRRLCVLGKFCLHSGITAVGHRHSSALQVPQLR